MPVTTTTNASKTDVTTGAEQFVRDDESKKNTKQKSAEEKLVKSVGLPPQVIPRLKEAFFTFDKDGDGSIDVEELGTLLASLGKQTAAAKVSQLIKDFNDDTGDPSVLLFPAFLRIAASGAVDVDALTGKRSDTNPDGNVEFSMMHKTLKPKEITKIRQAVERDNVKSLKKLMEEYDFHINCTLNFLVRFLLGEHFLHFII